MIAEDRLSAIIANSRDISHFTTHEQAFASSFKAFADECKLDASCMLVDYGIKSGRKEEEVDSAYASLKQEAAVWVNIKEGNTLLETYDPKDFTKLLHVQMLRQGLPKFFKLHFDAVAEERDKLVKGPQQIVEQYQTLAAVKKSLLQGHSVEIRRQIKTNGDNAQVSWCAQLKAWAIGSRNVAIVARSAKDLELYPEESRYFIARSIGLCWFGYLSNMDETIVNALKEELTNKTMVGDYVGNSKLINLIRYPKEAIIFHALVHNTRHAGTAVHDAYCLSNGLQIIKSFGLDVVPQQTFGVFRDYGQLCDQLK